MQQLLPTFKPTESDLAERAMALPLEDKIRNAIGLLQLHEPMARRLWPEGYWLAFSGGKDSCVIKELARMAGVAFLPVYNVTTIDPPELVRFIKREHPDVLWSRPRQAMMTHIARQADGPPTRLARWCCREYKETGGINRFKMIGVRAAESKRRADLWKQARPDRNGAGWFICPILYWTDADVWEFIRSRGLLYCELYDENFARLGRIGCPLAGPKQVAKEFARWPRYEALWKRAVIRNWERWHDVPRNDGKPRYQAGFATGEDFWRWWLSGERKDDTEECQMSLLFT